MPETYRNMYAKIIENHAETATKCDEALIKFVTYGLSDFAKSITYLCDFTRYDGSEIAAESM